MYLWLIPAGIYLIFFVPYLSVIPGNDGGLEFMFANRWYTHDNLMQLLSLHPPFKLILNSFFYQFFGYWSTGWIGLIFGIAGIYAIYLVAQKLFDRKVALLSSLLLATSGLYISVGLFGIHDFLITVILLFAFFFYLESRYVLYTIFICIAVLTKETAIFFALSIVLSDIFIRKTVKFESFIPLVILAWYIEFLHFSGYHLWNDWNFSPNPKQGSFMTMVNNIIKLQLFNKYAYENWLHLFVFNFNWVYWIFALCSFFFLKTKEIKKKLAPIGIYLIVFLITVLSFQTFTINRYVLPLLPFVYILASYTVMKLRFTPFFITLLLIVSLVSLTNSADPVSNLLWQKTQVLDQKIYLNHPLDGDDGITYNMQYLTIMQERTTMLETGNCSFPVLLRYDTQELALLHVNSCK